MADLYGMAQNLAHRCHHYVFCWMSALIIFIYASGWCYLCVPTSTLFMEITLIAWWSLLLPAPHPNSQHHRFLYVFTFSYTCNCIMDILNSFLISRVSFFFFKSIEQILPGSLQESVSDSHYHHWYFFTTLLFQWRKLNGETSNLWKANGNVIRAEADDSQPLRFPWFIFMYPFSLMGFFFWCFYIL